MAGITGSGVLSAVDTLVPGGLAVCFPVTGGPVAVCCLGVGGLGVGGIVVGSPAVGGGDSVIAGALVVGGALTTGGTLRLVVRGALTVLGTLVSSSIPTVTETLVASG